MSVAVLAVMVAAGQLTTTVEVAAHPRNVELRVMVSGVDTPYVAWRTHTLAGDGGRWVAQFRDLPANRYDVYAEVVRATCATCLPAESAAAYGGRHAVPGREDAMTREDFNGGWHYAAGVGIVLLLAPMLGHNLREWVDRRERHLALNVAVYAGAIAATVAFEAVQTYRHWSASGHRG